MEESTRQALGAAFIALASAAGPGALEAACETITHACDSGAVSDLAARDALRVLVRSCSGDREIRDVEALGREIEERVERLSPESPVEDLRALVELADALHAALDRFALAVAPVPTTINTVAAAEA